MVGLGLGAAVVDYDTEPRRAGHPGRHHRARRRRRPGRRAPAAARPPGPRLAARARRAWAAGWAVTTSIGIEVDEQFTVFGSSGAIVVTALTAVLPIALNRNASAVMSRHVVFGTGQVGRARRRAARRPRRRRRRREPQRPGRHRRRRGRRRRRHRPGVHHPGRGRRRRRLLLPQRHELRPVGRGVPAAAARRARRAPRPPAPASSCSTTSTPTARPTAATWSRPSRPGRPRPRPRPGPP